MKATLKDFLKAQDELTKLMDICYRDESNIEFDELYDNIYWQITGIAETIYEIEHGEEPCASELKSVKEMIAQIKSEYKRRVKKVDINWVYA